MSWIHYCLLCISLFVLEPSAVKVPMRFCSRFSVKGRGSLTSAFLFNFLKIISEGIYSL